MNKQKFLDFAHAFDMLRVVPRMVLFIYGGWVAHVIDRVLTWYMQLPSSERTLEASGLAGAIITVITGLFPWIYKIYSDAATDWSAQPVRSSTVTVSQSTQTVAQPPG